ncbi:MAG: hypothetical protein BWY98_01193 [Tenericutes bacterium ADurb.BinA155]|nr:MAG: hypothetical protein BWY98_01193 [Tenericutes bacterium ADurb.BinA155]
MIANYKVELSHEIEARKAKLLARKAAHDAKKAGKR